MKLFASHPQKHYVHPLSLPRRKRPQTLLLMALGTAGILAGAATYGVLHLPASTSTDTEIATVQPVQLTREHLPTAIVDMTAKAALPASLNLKVGNGDTLIGMLTDSGISPEEAHEAVMAIREIYDPRKLNIGQEVALELNSSNEDPETPTITSLTLPVSNIAEVKLTRSKNGDFKAKKIEAALKTVTVRARAHVRSSFYQAMADANVPASQLADLIKAYSYDVDFQRDIKPGDRVDILIERRQTDDGIVAGYGHILYSKLDLGERSIGIYRYTDKSGNTDYYNEKGESLRKALLRTPINAARISSGFGMRNHPILGYSKMHRGVDFAAPQGTPIFAAGDGVVQVAGTKSGYGNYVSLKHNATYTTAYAHMSKIANNIRNGAKVKQGQVIGYVGSTGMATGPHLHYEVLVSGTQVNPSGVKFKTGNQLAGAELKQFKAKVSEMQLALKQETGNKVASRETGKIIE